MGMYFIAIRRGTELLSAVGIYHSPAHAPILSSTLAQERLISTHYFPSSSRNPIRRFSAAEGVYGASVGTSILDAMGVRREDVVPRGIAMGGSAHSIGTAALMERESEVGG